MLPHFPWVWDFQSLESYDLYHPIKFFGNSELDLSIESLLHYPGTGTAGFNSLS